MYVLHHTFILAPHTVPVSSKANWVWENTLTCGEVTSTHIHAAFLRSLSSTAGWEKRGLDHPGLRSQRAALMWHKHMCGARAQSLLKHTRKTEFYCLLCGIITPRHWNSEMLKRGSGEREREKVRERQPPPGPGSAKLKYWSRLVTPREGKPAQSYHISINQLSSKVNKGLIKDNNGEHLCWGAFFPLLVMSVSVICLAELWLRRLKHGMQAGLSHPSILMART